MALTAALVIDLHLDWRRADNGVLLRVSEQDVDVWGQVRQSWTRLTRSCGPVQELQAADALWDTALAAIRAYSPPDSQTARITRLTRHSDWLLAQVESDRLLPAVVTLQQQGAGIALVPQGVWSGNTAPWLASPWIRDYLLRQVPQLPRALVDCLEVAVDSPLQRSMPLPPPLKDTR
ncbi:MAG: hypothetical protein RIS88_1776 [Pseudomonadota bacterium]